MRCLHFSSCLKFFKLFTIFSVRFLRFFRLISTFSDNFRIFRAFDDDSIIFKLKGCLKIQKEEEDKKKCEIIHPEWPRDERNVSASYKKFKRFCFMQIAIFQFRAKKLKTSFLITHEIFAHYSCNGWLIRVGTQWHCVFQCIYVTAIWVGAFVVTNVHVSRLIRLFFAIFTFDLQNSTMSTELELIGLMLSFMSSS